MVRQASKIVVLDGFTLSPGDLSWGELRELGECTIHDRTKIDDIIPRARGAGVVLTNKVPLSAETISQLPDLRYIGVLATGYNIVDVEFAKAHRILVTNVPSYGTQSVAQTVFAHLLNFTQHVANHSAAVRSSRWVSSPDWCFWDSPLIELAQLHMGVVGLGRIGRSVAKLADAFGMQVYAYTRNSTTVPDFVQSVDLKELFRRSDVLSLHCPLTPDTKHLVNADTLALMKPTAILINTSRGPLIDERALAEALNGGRIAGAGLDVLSVEPPTHDNPLLTAENCQITPHFAWATHAARTRLLQAAVANIVAFLAGKPTNVVN
jgi:glycerate dehydrogenase